MKLSKVLITGGAGFVGSHLAEELVNKSFETVILDDLSTGKMENLEEIMANEKMIFLRGDIRDRNLLDFALKDIEAVFHLAAVTSVTFSMKNPTVTKQINYEGTRILLEASTKNRVKKFIYVSSSSVYGDPEYIPIDEKHTISPISPYAESKMLAEKACLEFWEKHGMKIVIVRPFNIYGLRQRKDQYSGVISRFVQNLHENRRPIIYGDGTQTRDFIFVKDIANGLFLALENNTGENGIFNMGTGIPTSINDLASMLIELTGKKALKPLHRKPRSGEIKHSYADTKSAKHSLGFEPRTTLKEGLKTLVPKNQ